MKKAVFAKSFASVVAIAGAAIAQGAYAQEVQADETEATSSGEIVVTAQKREEKIRDVPAVILVRDTEQLATAGVRSPTDLGTAFPGLTFGNSNSVAQPAIRGVTTNASGASVENPVAVYIDGVYQPMQAMVNSFDVTNIGSIQVLKGPQGTLFGRNVVAGAVIVNTRDPDLEDVTGRLAVTASNFGGGSSKSAFYHSETGFVSAPLVRSKLAVSLAGGYYDRGAYTRNIAPGGVDVGDFKRYSLQGKLLWQPNDDIRVLFNGRYYKENAFIGASIRDGSAGVNVVLRKNAAGARLFSDGIVAGLPWQTAQDQLTGSKLEVQSYSLRAEFNTDIGKFTSTSAYQKAISIQFADNDSGYSPLCIAAKACSQLIFQYRNPEIISQELNYTSKKFGKFSFVTGVFGYSKKSGLPVSTSAVGFVRNAEALQRSFAGYFDGTFDITDRLSFIFGGRYTFDTEYERGTNVATLPFSAKHTESFSNFSKRFVLKYRPADSLNLYASYSEGYQSGFLVTTAYYNPTTLAPLPFLKPVRPQFLKAYESGAKFNLSGVTLNASVFHYDYKDLVVQLYNGQSILFDNAAGAAITGVDIDGVIPIGSTGLSLTGGISWLPEAKYTDFPAAAVTVPNPVTQSAAAPPAIPATNLTGDRLIRSPKVTATLGVAYVGEIGNDKITLNANLYHSSGFHTQLGSFNDAKGYTTLGLSASYSPNEGPLTFTIYGRNLTNKAYLNGTVASALGFRDYWAPPREIGGSVAFKF